MATRRYYSAVAVDNTVASSISNSATSVILTSSPVGFPSSYPFVVALDYDTASEELVLVTGATGTTLTITRAFNGSTAVAHNAGATVRHVIVAQDLTDFQDHAAATGAAHGITGAFVGTTDTQTLTNKTISGGSITGSISAAGATISGGTITGATSVSATITGATITSSTLSGGSITGSITAAGATISGATISGGSITGATSVNPTISGASISTSKFTIGLNAQTGTTYTLVASDQDKLVTLSNSSAITLTVPASVFSTGAIINIQQIGAGQVTVQGDGTSTVTGTGTKLRAQYSAASIVCTGTNTFTLIGDIA